MRAVLYLRLSHSTDESTSLARQERDLRQHAERQGWQVVEVLVDDGVSGRRSRDRADRAVAMLASGEADVLAVAALDRFTRQGIGAIGRLVEALERNPRARFVALRDGLDSSSPAWRLIASVLSEVARTEAENTASRVRSSRAYLRRANRFPGGVVPFGYRVAEPVDGAPGRVLVPDEREVGVLRTVADLLLGGASSSAAVRHLVREGVPTGRSAARRAIQAGEDPAGLERGTWYVSTIRKVWTSETLLGRVTERGETLRDVDGLPLTVWEPVLDLATVTRLRDLLRLPTDTRRTRNNLPTRPLSGLLFCAGCGARCHVRRRGSVVHYQCSSPATGSLDGCGCPSIRADWVEDYVSGLFLSVAGSLPEVVESEDVDDVTPALLAEVEEAISATTAALGLDETDVPAALARLASLKERRAELRAGLRPPSESTVYTGRTLAEAWADALDAPTKRALLASALDHVALLPGRLGGVTALDPARLAVYWSDAGEDYDAP